MEKFETFIDIIAVLAYVVYRLQLFSNAMDSIGSDNPSKWISKVSVIALGGFVLGGIATSIVQSSTLISSLTVSLVNSGVVTFRDSLLILLGTNIGNTATAWIVSMDADLLGPLFIV